MKSSLVTMAFLFVFASASVQADIVRCSSSLAGEGQNLVAFIQRDGSTGETSSRPSDDVVLARIEGADQPGMTLGHFKGEEAIGYDVDEGIRLFPTNEVKSDDSGPNRIVMGRKLGDLDDLHIYWPQNSDFQTASSFSTQIRADVKAPSLEYDRSLAQADAAPLNLGRKNVEPTSYSLQCSKVDPSHFGPNDKLDANGNFIDLEAMHPWALNQLLTPGSRTQQASAQVSNVQVVKSAAGAYVADHYKTEDYGHGSAN